MILGGLVGWLAIAHAASGSCAPREPERGSAKAVVPSSPQIFFSATSDLLATQPRCKRSDVTMRDGEGAGEVRVMAYGLTRAPQIGSSPVWLAGDRAGLTEPTVEGALLLELFDRKGQPAGVRFIGSKTLQIHVRGKSVRQLSVEGPLDVSSLLGAQGHYLRVTALTHRGRASSSGAYLVPDAHRNAELLRLEQDVQRRAKEASREIPSGVTLESGPDETSSDPGSFEQHTWTSTSPTWANRIVRVGDVDNFGMGFPEDFNPFSGETTNPHGSPFYPDPGDPRGTDRIMVGTGYDGNPPQSRDLYLRQVGDAATPAEPILFEFLAPADLEQVLLQVFLDDLSPHRYKGKMRVTLDGRAMVDVGQILNRLDQSNQVGRLLSFAIQPQFYELFEDGRIELLIDDPSSGAGDAFAIDFAQLAFNPTELPYQGEVEGQIINEKTGEPVAGALVTTGFAATKTRADGTYTLAGVPAGLVVIQVIAENLPLASIEVSVKAGGVQRAADVELEPPKKGDISAALAEDGQAELTGVRFSSGSYDLEGSSIETLSEVRDTLIANPRLYLSIEGHTDNIGLPEKNKVLSQNRAQSVVDWLVTQGVARSRLQAVGFGQDRPRVSNDLPEGQAANRRVELIASKVPR